MAIQHDGEEEIDLLHVIKRLINLKASTLYMNTFSMDKKMYLSIVDIVRGRPGSSQHTLEITCPKAHDGAYDLQFHGHNRYLVKLI